MDLQQLKSFVKILQQLKSLVPLCQSCLLVSLSFNGMDSLVYLMLKTQTDQAIWTLVKREPQKGSD